MAQATRENTDVSVRVVAEKGAIDEVKHVVEMVPMILVYICLRLSSFMLPVYYVCLQEKIAIVIEIDK